MVEVARLNCTSCTPLAESLWPQVREALKAPAKLEMAELLKEHALLGALGLRPRGWELSLGLEHDHRLSGSRRQRRRVPRGWPGSRWKPSPPNR